MPPLLRRRGPAGDRRRAAPDLDGLDKVMASAFAAFPDLAVQTLRTVAEGDTVVTEEVMEGTHVGHFAGLAPTGRRFRLPVVHVTRVVDGRIVERTAYHDTAQILRQLAAEAEA